LRKEIVNLPASIHARLRNVAEERGLPTQVILQHYALERFLYRLSQTDYKNDFVLRGGLIFAGWGIDLRRPTLDIDLLGYTATAINSLEEITTEICDYPVEPDGLRFDPESIRAEEIMESRKYPGVRVKFDSYLGNVHIRMQIDFGFDDQITPHAIDIQYPTILDFSPPVLYGYPYETLIAEKTQSLITLGDANTRMKDFYDVWLLIHQVELDGKTLSTAILNTFRKRNTEIPQNLSEAISDSYAVQQENQWQAFLNSSDLAGKDIPSFEQIIAEIKKFIDPLFSETSQGAKLAPNWHPSGNWE
jgi:predicted nucleotidyltransferase component of viral defense system